MNPNRIRPTGHEAHFADDEIIVSKTDLRGLITYANDVFLRVADTRKLNFGEPHNIIRHPDMPRCVFKLLWDTIQAGQESSPTSSIWPRTAVITGFSRTSRQAMIWMVATSLPFQPEGPLRGRSHKVKPL